MRIAVVGCGGMGSWFAEYFSSRGHSLTVSDVRRERASALAVAIGAKIADSNVEAVSDVDLTLLCVPIEETYKVIYEVAPYMKRGIIAEISSLKGRAVEALRWTSRLGLIPLSLHPLFGPSTLTLRGRGIAIIPVMDEGREIHLARGLFPEAELTVIEEEHDRLMGLILSLPYLLSLALASLLMEEELHRVRRLSGTTFTLLLAMVEGVVEEESHLLRPLLREGISRGWLERFLTEIEGLKEMIKRENELENLIGNLRQKLNSKGGIKRRERIYTALRR